MIKFGIAGIWTRDLPLPQSKKTDALDRSATVGRQKTDLFVLIQIYDFRQPNFKITKNSFQQKIHPLLVYSAQAEFLPLENQ